MPDIRYLRITLTDGTRFILRVTSESELLVRGIEVTPDGEEVVPPGPAGYHQRLRIVGRDLIKENRCTAHEQQVRDAGESSCRGKKTPAQLEAEIAEALNRRRAPR
jgi:hypothetical protein